MAEVANSENVAALVLAAGKGTRMRSTRPKVLHTLLGEPMLAYPLAALEGLGLRNILVIAGHGAREVSAAFPNAAIIIQEVQLGTGHAAQTAMPVLEESGAEYALVVNGDSPLVGTTLLREFMERARGCDMAFATMRLPDPGAYGRVARKDSRVTAIVEARDFDPAVHGEATGEVNAGIYLFRIAALKELLPLLNNANKSGEYYLTDLVALAVEKGFQTCGIECGSDENLLGINSPAELATLEERLRAKVAGDLLGAGVLIHAPRLVMISPFARLEAGCEICGPCEIYGRSIIKSGVFVASHCVIRDSVLETGARVLNFSHLEGAHVGEGARVGPYTRLRPGAEMARESHAGNFVELKKALLGEGAKANHLTYLGDCEIGAHTNIGAGTITCNYDGKHKHRTIIGENAFIGSNTALVAPVEVGEEALIGAGSVITHNVPARELGIARAKQRNLRPRKKHGE